jgi:hypothetical protein
MEDTSSRASSAKPPIGTMSSASSGIYKPLDRSKTQIRLATIDTSTALDSGIAISLKVHDLDSKGLPKYHALSYEWKPPEVRSPHAVKVIEINGHKKMVGLNLYMALFALQIYSLTVINCPIWIDALCINQDLPHERSHQVGLMARIYSLAEHVLIWPGPVMYFGPWGFSFDMGNCLRKFKQKCLDYVKKHPYDDTDAEATIQRVDGFTCNLTKDIKLQDRNLIDSLCNSSYWQRSWIIQELYFAKSLQILYINKDQAPYSGLCSLGLLASLWPLSLDLMFAATREKGLNSCWKPSNDAVLRIYVNNLDAQMPESSLILPQNDLLVLLNRFSDHLTSDPRDKVYSLLGMASPYGNMRLTVDYSISYQQVFINKAIFIVKGSRSLDILASAGSRSPDLPSWAPDWTIQDPKRLLYLAANGFAEHLRYSVIPSVQFANSNGDIDCPRFSENQTFMILTAQLVDIQEYQPSTRSPHTTGLQPRLLEMIDTHILHSSRLGIRELLSAYLSQMTRKNFSYLCSTHWDEDDIKHLFFELANYLWATLFSNWMPKNMVQRREFLKLMAFLDLQKSLEVVLTPRIEKAL